MEQKLQSYCLWWTLVLCLFLSPDEKGEIWKGDAFVASLMVDQTKLFLSYIRGMDLGEKILPGQE